MDKLVAFFSKNDFSFSVPKFSVEVSLSVLVSSFFHSDSHTLFQLFGVVSVLLVLSDSSDFSSVALFIHNKSAKVLVFIFSLSRDSLVLFTILPKNSYIYCNIFVHFSLLPVSSMLLIKK
jgi:hypothetical protein